MSKKHIDADDSKAIQMRLHKTAKHWLDRGYCPSCTARVILAGAVAVGMDVRNMTRADFHEAIDYFFDDAQHAFHGSEGETRQ